MSQSRQPAGVPVGGQFAANAHDEAGAMPTPIIAPGGKMDFGETRSTYLMVPVSEEDVDPYEEGDRMGHLAVLDGIGADVTRIGDENGLERYEFVLHREGGLPVSVTTHRGSYAQPPTPPMDIALGTLVGSAWRSENPDSYDENWTEDDRLEDRNNASKLRSLVGEKNFYSYVSPEGYEKRMDRGE